MNPADDNTDAEPTLPPSPLAQVLPAPPPDVPLPGSAVPFGALAGLIAGAVYWAVGMATARGQHPSVWMAVYQAGVYVAAVVLVVLGAAVCDRLAPTWPRGVRWACGMGAAALAGVGVWLGAAHRTYGLVGFPTRDIVGAFACTGVSYALVGAVLGLVAGSSRDLLWRLPLAGFTATAAVLALRLGLLRLLGAPLLIVGPAGSIMGPILGLLLGFVMAERLNAARRRAIAQDSAWIEE